MNSERALARIREIEARKKRGLAFQTHLDHPLSGHLEIRDFILKLMGEDLPRNPKISDDRCEQWLLKGKRLRRRIEVQVDWFKPTD